MIIVIQCSDRIGLVSAIANVLADHQLNIVSMREHVDVQECRFYARLQVGQYMSETLLYEELRAVLPEGGHIVINPEPEKKVVILVTKEYHCLADLLARHHFGNLGASVQCVIGNHDLLRDICERFDVPFELISHENKDKDQFEEELRSKIVRYSPDYVILAKFMRILSPVFVANFTLRIINIHHSFLPAFIGANPYRKAFERGVKLIGATAHFVTNDLDEGPIIEQQIIPVNHTFTAASMVKAGKEIESAVLAKALRLVFEDRVFVYKNKTVVFE